MPSCSAAPGKRLDPGACCSTPTSAPRNRAPGPATWRSPQAPARILVWVRTEEAVTRTRLAARDEGPESSVSDAGTEVYKQLRGLFEAPNAEEGMTVVEIDGAAEVEGNVDAVLVGVLV